MQIMNVLINPNHDNPQSGCKDIAELSRKHQKEYARQVERTLKGNATNHRNSSHRLEEVDKNGYSGLDSSKKWPSASDMRKAALKPGAGALILGGEGAPAANSQNATDYMGGGSVDS